MTPKNDLAYATIEELAPRIAARELSPVELTQAQLERIERLNPTLNAYVTVMAGTALAEARAAEAAIGRGEYRGPLHGVPVAVKDLCFTAGVVTAGGTKVLQDHVPDEDGTVVARLRAAGAVLLGKLTLTEGAMGGYHPDLQIPLNPWDPGRWTGVSSSGSGVATASGQCYGSLGSDTGGSIRFPAASCGTVGLKPTYGRVSRAGVLVLAESMDHVGPLTRSTADAAIMLGAIAGQDPRDPTSLPEPVPDYLAQIDDGVAGLRIGFDQEWATERVDPEIVQVVDAAVQTMRGLGAEIVELTMPPVEDVVAEWWDLCGAEAAVAHAATFPSRADDYGAFFRYYLQRGTEITGADYVRGHIKRIELNARLREAFSAIDAIVCPAMATPAFPITPAFYLEEPKGVQTWRLRFTAPFDMNGAPTITLPAGLHSDGVPLSLQFVGKSLNEDVLFRLGRAYERATGFVPMRPPVD